MTKDQQKTTNTKELTANGESDLKKVMNDEELKEYLDGQPNAVCEFETFLNEINKKDKQNVKLLEQYKAIFMSGVMKMNVMSNVDISVLENNNIVIKSKDERIELDSLEIFETYFE